MFRKLLMFLFALALVEFPVTVSGANDLTLPEKNGVYFVSGRPDLRLRVIVHHGKPDAIAHARANGKPLPPSPVEQCSLASTADPSSDSVVDPAGWTLPNIWSYRVNTASIPSTIGSLRGQQLIANSFVTWQSELMGDVAFSNAGITSVAKAQRDNQNIVTWGRTSGSALAVTYTWYSTLTEEAVEIDTIFNKSFTWYWSDPSEWETKGGVGYQCAYIGVYDAQDILTHEIGHTVGLDDEYATGYVNNTMYGYGSTGETKKNSLTAGDKAGVAALYQP